MKPLDPWNPEQYERFLSERRQPFDDLLQLVSLPLGGQVLDLGCGTGELTRELHERLQAKTTLGVDKSANMLSKARNAMITGLRFSLADIETFDFTPKWDLIFSNAALQWIPDHPALLRRLRAGLSPGGQIAVQLPAMENHATHTVARLLAQRSEYAAPLEGFVHHLEALEPECYAGLLADVGFRQQHVRLQVYGHLLPSTEALVDWMRGTLLTCYQRRLSEPLFETFVEDYREGILEKLGHKAPFFFPFRRILFWAAL